MTSQEYNNTTLKEEIKTLTGLTVYDECPSDVQLYFVININNVRDTLFKIGAEKKYNVNLTESTIWLTNPDISFDELWRINAKLLELLPSFCKELDFKECIICRDNTMNTTAKIQFFCVDHDTICVCDVFLTDLTPSDDE
jgi:hypothetical protein